MRTEPKTVLIRQRGLLFLCGVTILGIVFGFALVYSTQKQQDSIEAVRLAESWGLTNIPSGTRAQEVRHERAGEGTTRVYLFAPKEVGGFGVALARLNCFAYSDPKVDGQAMHAFLESEFQIPPLDEVVGCGTCKLDEASQVRFMRFTSGDVIQIERTKL